MYTHKKYNKLENIKITISNTLNISLDEIHDIEVLKKGMTNRSFLFSYRGKRYIIRMPGEGTEKLINRKTEVEVYDVIGGRGISDNIIYINPQNGYKITEYFEGARVCNPDVEDDLKKCIDLLRKFHQLHLSVKNKFDLYEQIDLYETLWGGKNSIYSDYMETKNKINTLKKYIDRQNKEYCLTHIDANPDNFLFTSDGKVRLIDWEYAGMQDPHVDIAMFCIYSMYDKWQVDRLIDIYFNNKCTRNDRLKIYCYISTCGLLWSNWCEYKSQLGVEFGKYSLQQYRYAKEYYELVVDELGGSL